MSDSAEFIESLRAALTPKKQRNLQARGILCRDLPRAGTPYFTVTLPADAKVITLRREWDEGDDQHVIAFVGLLPGRNFVDAKHMGPDGAAPVEFEDVLHEIEITGPHDKAPRERDTELTFVVRNTAEPLDTLLIGRQLLLPTKEARLVMRERDLAECLPQIHGFMRRGYIALDQITPKQLADLEAANDKRKKSREARLSGGAQ